MKFCPQCGSSLTEGDAFCEKCSLKIEHEAPVASSVPSNEIPKTEPVIPLQQPADQFQYPQAGIGADPKPQPNDYVTDTKGKGKLVPVLITVGIILVLGAGGWLVYANFIKSKPEVTIADSTKLKTPTTPTVVPDTTPKVNEQQPSQSPASASESKTNQGVSSQPAKTSTPVSKPVNTNVSANENRTGNNYPPETNMQSSPSVNDEPPSHTIFEVGQMGLSILKNPGKECVFTLRGRYCITRITTDHYNSGSGTPRTGTIGIKDRDGNIIQRWHASGRSNSDGVRNCKWVVEPHIFLDAGNYMIFDSDRETWTKKITGVGFVIIEGYKAP